MFAGVLGDARTVGEAHVPPPAGKRIVLIGDSVMGEVAAAVEAATAGRATVHYVLTIGTANVTDDWWDVWPRVLAEDRPDAIAVLVGPWEINRDDVGSPAWSSWYAGRLDRWAAQLRAGGASLHWMTSPPLRDAAMEPRLQIVNDAFRSLAARRHDLSIVESGSALGSSAYVERTTTGERLRRIDGLHLCPAGVVRMATALLHDLHVAPVPGWQRGAWIHSAPAYSPVECPA